MQKMHIAIKYFLILLKMRDDFQFLTIDAKIYADYYFFACFTPRSKATECKMTAPSCTEVH